MTLSTATSPTPPIAAVPPPAARTGSPVDLVGDALHGLPLGLTRADADRVAAAINAARTESSRTVYACAWRQWQSWCTDRGLTALPGHPLALCAYLTERAEAGYATGILDLACTAIRHVHRTCGATDSVASETVQQVRRGLRRTYGTAPRRLARPLGVDDIRQILIPSTVPRCSVPATPRSSCSATPPPYAALNWSL